MPPAARAGGDGRPSPDRLHDIAANHTALRVAQSDPALLRAALDDRVKLLDFRSDRPYWGKYNRDGSLRRTVPVRGDEVSRARPLTADRAINASPKAAASSTVRAVMALCSYRGS